MKDEEKNELRKVIKDPDEKIEFHELNKMEFGEMTLDISKIAANETYKKFKTDFSELFEHIKEISIIKKWMLFINFGEKKISLTTIFAIMGAIAFIIAILGF